MKPIYENAVWLDLARIQCTKQDLDAPSLSTIDSCLHSNLKKWKCQPFSVKILSISKDFLRKGIQNHSTFLFEQAPYDMIDRRK
jgi:hypothetical protein